MRLWRAERAGFSVDNGIRFLSHLSSMHIAVGNLWYRRPLTTQGNAENTGMCHATIRCNAHKLIGDLSNYASLLHRAIALRDAASDS